MLKLIVSKKNITSNSYKKKKKIENFQLFVILLKS